MVVLGRVMVKGDHCITMCLSVCLMNLFEKFLLSLAILNLILLIFLNLDPNRDDCVSN